MIDKAIVKVFDQYLDEEVSYLYKQSILAQDWARVAKIGEEAGEAIAQLILWTGQNPRKGQDPEAFTRLLDELADTAMTAIYAIQHFTKDTEYTEQVLKDAMAKHVGYMQRVRVPKFLDKPDTDKADSSVIRDCTDEK